MSELLAGADISGLPQRGKVVVGFSGGADSTALAHWLLGRLGPERLVLAHVNHQLRGEESDRDEAAARAFAQHFGLDFAKAWRRGRRTESSPPTTPTTTPKRC